MGILHACAWATAGPQMAAQHLATRPGGPAPLLYLRSTCSARHLFSTELDCERGWGVWAGS
eukprot:15442114-Alexandrium_andersonii.AAC.1